MKQFQVLVLSLVLIFTATPVIFGTENEIKNRTDNDSELDSAKTNRTVTSFDELLAFRRPACTLEESTLRMGLTTSQLLALDGYTPETHFIITEDGYILETHRIPAPGKPVVYVLAGIFQSSRDLIMNCKGRSLAAQLVRDGYDVWLGNFRGNTYGRKHIGMSANKNQFWQHSIDDLSQYDAPAALNYILKATGQPKLNWVGFSLGNTLLITMLSMKPEYNDKIICGVAMAPAIYFASMPSPIMTTLAPLRETFESTAFKLFGGEILPPRITRLLHGFAGKVCMKEAEQNTHGTCSEYLGYVDGVNPAQHNLALLPLILAGSPCPISAQVVKHWLQWIGTKEYRRYDYGFEGNLNLYGTPKPPLHNISNVRIPMYTLYAKNDFLTSPPDVTRVNQDLPNLIGTKQIDLDRWNHLDFLYGKDADIYVYRHVLKTLRAYNEM